MELEQDWDTINAHPVKSRKEFAALAIKSLVPGALFSLLDGRVKDVREFLLMMHIDRLAELLDVGGAVS